MEQTDNNTFQLVLGTYRALLDELKFMKQQQWLTVYYQMLLIGGIYAFGHSLLGSGKHPTTRVVLVLCAVLVALLGTFLVGLIHCDIVETRLRIKKILESNFDHHQREKIELSDGDQIAQGVTPSMVKTAISWIKTIRLNDDYVRGLEFTIVMIGISWIAVVLVSCALLRG